MSRNPVARLLATLVGIAACLTPVPALADPASPTVLSLPDVTTIKDDIQHHIELIGASEISVADARVELRLDYQAISRFAAVTAGSAHCASRNFVLTCANTVDLVAGQNVLAAVLVKSTAAAKVGDHGAMLLTGSVNGVAAHGATATVTIDPSPDLDAIGTTVYVTGRDKVRIKVGAKNVGTAPWQPHDPHGVAVYVYLPEGSFAESAPTSCAGWDASPEGWNWESPGQPSYKYACIAYPINPGQSVLFEMTISVPSARPIRPGSVEVYLGEGNRSNDTAPIVLRASAGGGGAGLPVTGGRTNILAGIGAGLLLTGALLLMLTRRRATMHRLRPAGRT